MLTGKVLSTIEEALFRLLVAALPCCCILTGQSDPGTTSAPPDLHILGNLTDLRDYVVIENLSNGEKQIFTQNGSTWSQILTLSNSTDPGVSLVISANEQLVVKSIYRIDNQLLDCDILGEGEHAKFVEGFQNEIMRAVKQGNYEFHWTNEPNYTMLPTQVQSLQVEQQKDRCIELHRTILQATTKGAFREKRRRAHHHSYEGKVHRIRHQRRPSRSLFFPGTYWCGTGSRAQSSGEVGEHAEADKCCRQHDQCPMSISGLTKKYHLFNHRAHTISLCDCDKQFHECLRKAETDVAAMIGRIFFNIIRSPCFTLSLEDACEHYTWWGSCESTKVQWVAKLNYTDWF